MDNCTSSRFFDQNLFEKWKNYSNFTTHRELESYVCLYREYEEHLDFIESIGGYVHLFCGILGLVGSVLTFITLWSNKNFQSPSFIYFKAISILELFHMMAIILLGFRIVFFESHSSSYVWFWITIHICSLMINLFPSCVDILTITLSVERAVACLKPARFNAISTRRIALTVCAVTIAVLSVLFLPQAFSVQVTIDPTTHKYWRTNSEFGSTKAYQIINYFVDILILIMGICIIITTILFIVGMARFEHGR